MNGPEGPNAATTSSPTTDPTSEPTQTTLSPTATPSLAPTSNPSQFPSKEPSFSPSNHPSLQTTTSPRPTNLYQSDHLLSSLHYARTNLSAPDLCRCASNGGVSLFHASRLDQCRLSAIFATGGRLPRASLANVRTIAPCFHSLSFFLSFSKIATCKVHFIESEADP